MKYIVLLGRILYSYIFITSGIHHFSRGAIDYAANAGIPIAFLFVPLSGVVALLGGLSILLGFKAKWGGWLIAFFLVAVTPTMHHWWTITDPMMRQMDMINFNKNLGLLGGALFVAYFGAGAISIDAELSLRRMKSHLYGRHGLKHA